MGAKVLWAIGLMFALICGVTVGRASARLHEDPRWLRLAEGDAAFEVMFGRRHSAAQSNAIGTRLCEPDAAWIRLGFGSLALRGRDTLLVTSSDGDSYRIGGLRGERGPFELRALRGDCIEIHPDFSDSASRYALKGYEFGLLPLAQSTVVVAGSGDICDVTGNVCQRTSDVISSIAPAAVFVLGDNAYEVGSLSQYNTNYAPTWGNFKSITHPVPGNHEYATPDAAGYYDYFNGVGVQQGLAGDRSKGYYSWDIGDWHFVALNSNFSTTSTAERDQMQWLLADLAANTKPCTAAYFHYPYLSRGNYTGYDRVKPYWDALYAAHADLVLNGHDHNYQRYSKMNALKLPALDGIRQLVVGTGGRYLYPVSGSHPLLEVANSDSFGVLKLTLGATSYSGEFIPGVGSTFRDSFSGRCNKATSAIHPQMANCRLPPLSTSPAVSAVSATPVLPGWSPKPPVDLFRPDGLRASRRK
jgi:acid phosphatase type 7